MTLRKSLTMALTIAAVGCFTVSSRLMASGPVINYSASGTFGTATSGSDTLKLSGEPFTVAISVSSSTRPWEHGSNWAAYHKLKLTGTVHSGLLGSEPVSIGSSESSIIQAEDPGQYDMFTMEAPVTVVGISLTIKAVITMPYGTLTNELLQPFNAVSLGPGNATVTYSDSSAVTVLPITTGTLTAKEGSGSTSATANFRSFGDRAAWEGAPNALPAERARVIRVS